MSSLREREAQAKALIESQLQGVLCSMNDKAKTSDVTVAAILLALGCLGVFNMATGSLEGYRFWGFVLIFGGVAGFARLVYGLMERPMPALRSLLNVCCRWTAKRRLAAIGLSTKLIGSAAKTGEWRWLVSQDGEA